ncbi:MAG TPA: hypothetical protein VFK97_01990, partial [Candidatus Saccharimonadales bacterium]|nr:hypothetical protein [Candidatus Saccharimonadales bacterium]
KYGRPKAAVEAEIFKRLETKALPRPAGGPYGSLGAGRPSFGSSNLPPAGGFGSTSGLPSRPGPPAPAKPAAAGSSFLDEWLAKRQGAAFRPPAGPRPTQPPAKPAASRPAPTEPQPAKPARPELEVPAEPTHAEGVFHINRDTDPAQHQSQVVQIDKDGSISFGD